MRWSKLKQQLESRFAPSVRGRVELFQTRYRHAHDSLGEAWLTLDGIRAYSWGELNSLHAIHDAYETVLPRANRAQSTREEFLAADDAAPAARSKSSTCGRVKLLRLMRWDDGSLRTDRVFGNSLSGFLEPPTASVELEQVAVMHEPVEHGCDQHDITEQCGPVVDGAV